MAWDWLINKPKINRKRIGIKYFFYIVLKYDIVDKIEFKEDLLINLISELKKDDIKLLFFSVANTNGKTRQLNTLYVIVWKETIMRKDKKLEEIFERAKAQLNMVFNLKLIQLGERDIRLLFEKTFPFNLP
ncbi:MAG TPA: hypothetical protein VKU94_01850 [Geobacterales bacterium]|nr:hypothetical protein [Geobacterales bacterium]